MNKKLYRRIYLDDENFVGYQCGEENVIENLGRINMFVGPNNSGKSRFLRAVSMFNMQSNIVNGVIEFQEIIEFGGQLRKLLNELIIHIQVSDAKGVELEEIRRIEKRIPNPNPNWLKDRTDMIKDFEGTRLNVNWYLKENYSISNEAKLLIQNILSLIEKAMADFGSRSDLKKDRVRIYIPILRGLRNFPKEENAIDLYSIRTLKDYFGKIRELITKKRVLHRTLDSLDIFTGLSLFEDAKEMLLGDQEQRQLFADFEKFIGETFYNGDNFSIIPKIKDDVVHVKIGEKDEFPIYDLGDGIQALIVLLFPLFTNRDKDLSLFFEEPDQNLHPAFQRIFIDALMRDEFSHCQFFMTTHSNHFLDLTLDYPDISIYAFQEGTRSEEGKKQFEIKNVMRNDWNLLEQLGVRNSSVFLSNCTIWVEGITDRIYIRKFLDLMQTDSDKPKPKFKEDLHYSFVEYGGANITHWSFLDDADPDHPNIEVEALCAKLFLVADNDGAKAGSGAKAERIEKLEKFLKERFYCWQVREIENTLTPETIKQVIIEFEKNNEELDFSSFDGKDYSKIGLGKFLQTHVKGMKRNYKADSGTILNKVDFAKKAVTKMPSFEDLSKEAQDFTKKLYAFIKSNNI